MSLSLGTQRREWIVSSLQQDEKDGDQQQQHPMPEEKTKVPTRLILHLDINETILLGDDAGGDSRHDSVQKMLAKSAFCQIPGCSSSKNKWDDTQQVSPTHWWDGQEMGKETSMPPLYTGWEWPEGCCPYYRTNYKKFSKTFVDEHDGRIYKPVLEKCEEMLAQSHSNHILPAFYHTLHHLIEMDEPFTVVFRTFGSDIDEIAELVTKFAQGKHPDYPNVNYPPLVVDKSRLFQARWKKPNDDDNNDVTAVYQLWTQDESEVVASGDAEILSLLDQVTICGIRDDYRWWKKHGWDPTAGKPTWIPTYDSLPSSSSGGGDVMTYDHHLLFDDNIHNLPNDGIACVRKQQPDGTFETMDGATMHLESQGVHLIRVPTVEPVLNVNWFVEQIHQARIRLQHRLQNK